MKQPCSSSMILMVTAPPPLHIRPPPDPPPYEYPPLEALSSVAPPEPPDSVFLLVLPRSLEASARFSAPDLTQILEFKLLCTMVATNLSGDGARLVFFSDTAFTFVCLSPVMCRSFLQVHLSSPLFANHCSVEWVGMLVDWMTLVLWLLILNDVVLMDFVSFGSNLVSLSGFYIVSVRSLTVLEEKPNGVFLPVNTVLTGFDFPVGSCLDHSHLPIFPLVWSELDVQVLLVLQGSSSQLMHVSAFGAVFVTFGVTLDVIVQEIYEIVVKRFLWFLSVICIFFLSYVLPVFFVWLLIALFYPPLMECKL
ncbi:BnaA07g08380D [Brassica napus]|uniref:BnaA07g08380D protein n=1 Tax=Brassica napus TaxID=3708 RepID=A0A078FS41_BRANA|nr:BnaA07g08380D [Brassica napus]